MPVRDLVMNIKIPTEKTVQELAEIEKKINWIREANREAGLSEGRSDRSMMENENVRRLMNRMQSLEDQIAAPARGRQYAMMRRSEAPGWFQSGTAIGDTMGVVGGITGILGAGGPVDVAMAGIDALAAATPEITGGNAIRSALRAARLAWDHAGSAEVGISMLSDVAKKFPGIGPLVERALKEVNKINEQIVSMKAENDAYRPALRATLDMMKTQIVAGGSPTRDSFSRIFWDMQEWNSNQLGLQYEKDLNAKKLLGDGFLGEVLKKIGIGS
jgi:hypothetical protein